MNINLTKNVSSLLQTFTESHHRWKQTLVTSTVNDFSYFPLEPGGEPIGHWYSCKLCQWVMGPPL